MVEVKLLESAGQLFEKQVTKLDLVGDLLCIHYWINGKYISNFVRTSDLNFISRKRWDGKRLVRSVSAPLLGLLAALFLYLTLDAVGVIEVVPVLPAVLLAVFGLFAGLYSLYWFILFCMRRQAVKIRYAGPSHDAQLQLEFWHDKKGDPELSRWVEQLREQGNQGKKPGEFEPWFFISQDLDHIYPIRSAITTLASSLLMIYFLSWVVAALLKNLPEVRHGPIIVLLLIGLPISAAVWRYIFLRHLQAKTRSLNRRIFEGFRNEDDDVVEDSLKLQIGVDADHPTTLMFSYRLMLQWGEYEKALHSVNLIGVQNPETAEYLGELTRKHQEWSGQGSGSNVVQGVT